MKHAYATLIVAAALLAVPLGSAEAPLEPVEIRPPEEWQNADGSGYYLRAQVVDPEPPQGSENATGDCSRGRPPRDSVESVRAIAGPLLARPPDPTGFHGVSDWFPECAAVTVGVGPVRDGCERISCPVLIVDLPQVVDRSGAGNAYVAWGVASGHVYADTGPAGLGALHMRAPLAMDADCEDCPPPGLA